MPVDYSDDDALVAALRDGDEGAFAWLLDRYDASLRRVALGFVADRAVVDEVVQETWLGVINGVDRFQGRSSFKTWLYRILMNIARTRGVRESRSVPFSAADPAGGRDGDDPAFDPDRFRGGIVLRGHWAAAPAPWETEPSEHLHAAETLALVREVIDGLPPNQRAVVALRDVEGWSAAEVCNLLELSETNQRVLLHRGRAKVRRALEEHFEGGDR